LILVKFIHYFVRTMGVSRTKCTDTNYGRTRCKNLWNVLSRSLWGNLSVYQDGLEYLRLREEKTVVIKVARAVGAILAGSDDKGIRAKPQYYYSIDLLLSPRNDT